MLLCCARDRTLAVTLDAFRLSDVRVGGVTVSEAACVLPL